MEEVIQLPALLLVEPTIDKADEIRLALAGHSLGNLDQGRVGWKFHTTPQEVIGKRSDQIHESQHLRRGRCCGSERHAPTLVALELCDAKIVANGRLLSMTRRRTQSENSCRSDPHDLRDVLANLRGNNEQL